jgi:hypothetical protein
MKSLLSALFLIAAGLSLTSSAQAPAAAPGAPANAAPAKSGAVVGVAVVGTFDRSSIVLAYYRSPLWEAILADRRFELKTVKAANDTARATELEKYGGESQDLAMRQLAGKAPIDNIVAVLQPEIKELTARLKLSGVVDSSTADPKAPSVEVTPLLLDWLKATAETRKMAAEMHGRTGN